MARLLPRRCNIQYKYAIGIALKNCQPLLAKEIYNFIIVFMPNICSFKNKNWQNAVRNNLSTSNLFEKIEVIQEVGKSLCFYKLADGAQEEFDQMFSIEYGAPYDFLANPELYEKLYNGEIGYPSESEIDQARISFEQQQKLWTNSQAIETKKAKTAMKERVLNEKGTANSLLIERNQEIQQNQDWGNVNYSWTEGLQNNENQVNSCRFLGKSDENAEYYEEVTVEDSAETQMPVYDFRNDEQSSPGPLRNAISASGARTNPYQRPSAVLLDQPMPLVTSQLPPPPVYVHTQMGESNAPLPEQNHQISKAPTPEVDYDLFTEFFQTPISLS